MKVAVFTKTRDRLDYTKRCFATLAERAGHPYDHFVVDNGSSDGTADWLDERRGDFAGLILNERNEGIDGGFLQAREMMASGGYELAVSVDNDAELVTENGLARVVRAVESLHDRDEWILSPRVTGLVHHPSYARQDSIGGERVNVVSQVGGLFMAVPWRVLADFQVKPRMSPGDGSDTRLCFWHGERGGKVGYLQDVVVHHQDTTPGQIARYPDYWARKRRENGW